MCVRLLAALLTAALFTGCPFNRLPRDDDDAGDDDSAVTADDDDTTPDDDDTTPDDDDTTEDDTYEPCSTFDFLLMDDACQDVPLASDPTGPTVCACAVTQASPGAPFCTPPDPRAPLAATWHPTADPDHIHFGTWPDVSGLAGCPTDGDWSWFGDSFAGSGALDVDLGAGEERIWLEPTPTPDSAWYALFDRITPNSLHHLTLVGCEQAGGDPGWLAERVVQPVTTPFVRWGARVGDWRDLYLMSDDWYRITLAATTQQVLTDDGEATALVFKDLDWLAASEAGNLAFGDFDLSYETAGNVTTDRYAVTLSALDATLIPLYVEGAIYVTDLADCQADCDADSGLAHCCRTALLVYGNSDNPDIPTNPALSHDGALIAYNRFTSDFEQCPLGLCAEVHVLKNPYAHTDVWTSYCDSSGIHDGFTEAVDCTALMMDGDLFDDGKCPDYHCCDDGADCSDCVTIGEAPDESMACSGTADGVRERNYIAFFDIEDSTYLAFRSTDMLVNSQVDFQVFSVSLDGSGNLVVPDDDEGYPRVWDVAGPWFWDRSDAATGPYRKLPDHDPCD